MAKQSLGVAEEIPTVSHPTVVLAGAFDSGAHVESPIDVVPENRFYHQQHQQRDARLAGVAPLPAAASRSFCPSGLSPEDTASVEDLIRRKSHDENFPRFALTVEALSTSLLSAINLVDRPRITREHLVKNGVTVAELVGDCGVSVMDLKLAGIVTNYRDLVALRFAPADLKRDQKLLSITHLRMLCGDELDELADQRGAAPTLCELIFAGDWEKQMATPGQVCRGLAKLRFSVDELKTLGFSFTACFPENHGASMLKKELLAKFALDETDCHKLGLTKRMMKGLGLDFKFCRLTLNWNMEVAATLWGIKGWSQDRSHWKTQL